MAETRTYEPDDGDGLGRLVREALGETVRPFQPGDPSRYKSADELDAEDEAEAQAELEATGIDPDELNSFTAAWPSWTDADGE